MVLIAVMVDRRAVTFRTLAVAAMIVLAIAPEALVHPSFQMSFAATPRLLVALVQVGMPPPVCFARSPSATAYGGVMGRPRNAMPTLACWRRAGGRRLYAAFHFHRVTALWRDFANWRRDAGGPALVMPAGLLGLVAIAIPV